MQTIDQPAHRIDEAERPLWFGETPTGWGDTLRAIDPSEAHDAAAMIVAAGLDWRVEQYRSRRWSSASTRRCACRCPDTS